MFCNWEIFFAFADQLCQKVQVESEITVESVCHVSTP
jgi:hypothetical protein